MKTKTFLNFNYKPQCSTTGRKSFSDYCSSFLSHVSQFVALTKIGEKKILKNSESENLKRHKVSQEMIQVFVRAGLALVARSKVYVATREVNWRIIVGVVCGGIFAPFADAFYTFFDRDAKLSWVPYYDNWFFLFLCIGPYIQSILTTTAAYLIFVTGRTKRVYFLGLLFLGSITKIIWLLFARSHDEFLAVPDLIIYLYVFALVTFLLFIADYLAWRKYHRADAHKARMDTITTAHKMKLLPPEKIADDYATTWNEIKIKAY